MNGLTIKRGRGRETGEEVDLEETNNRLEHQESDADEK